MKYLITLLVSLSLVAPAVAESKKICHTFKGKQNCKIVKIHKKLENTTVVPVKRKK